MENKMNKFGLKRVLAVLAVAFACVCMWGCGDDLERKWGPIEWSSPRTVGGVIGFIDDSLVIVSDWRHWSQEQDGFVYDGGTISGIGHQGLRVYNYRVQEEGPRWTDTLDNANTNGFTYLVGQLSDSIVWGGNGNNSFSFWKLGQKPVVMNVTVSKDGCNATFKHEKMRTWLNGKILLKGPLGAGGDSCQYAVLDTIVKTLTFKRLDANLKWIEKCDDVRAWGDDVYCIMRKKNNWSVLLSVGNIVVDSIEFDENRKYAVYPALFAGSMLHMGDYVCSIANDKIMRNPYVKSLSDLMFVNADGSVVKY